MDIKPILTDLRTELNRLNQAIATLESLDGTATATTPAAKAAPKRGGRRRMSAAGRKRISEAAKARWAVRRKQVAKPASKKTTGRRTVSAASRKKMAEAQRKRWAARKAKTA
jgi:general stress protein YciG